MSSLARNTYGEHGQPGGLVVLPRQRSNSGYASNSNRSGSSRKNPTEWRYGKNNTNYGSISHIHQPKNSNRKRMNNMSKAHAKAMKNYNQASEGFVPLSDQLPPSNTLYGRLPSESNKYAIVKKKPANSETLYGESSAPSRPSNRNSWRPRMPLPETEYEPQYGSHAVLNKRVLGQSTRTVQPKEETNYGTVAGTATKSGQIVPLFGSRPTRQQQQLLLDRLMESGNARESTKAGGSRKRTRKNNNKKRTQKQSKSKSKSRKHRK